MRYIRNNNNIQNNIRIKQNKNKTKISKKNIMSINLNKDEISNTKNSNNYFGTMMNENTSSHFNNYNKKLKTHKNKSSSIGDTVFRKKRGDNKRQ